MPPDPPREFSFHPSKSLKMILETMKSQALSNAIAVHGMQGSN